MIQLYHTNAIIKIIFTLFSTLFNFTISLHLLNSTQREITQKINNVVFDML